MYIVKLFLNRKSVFVFRNFVLYVDGRDLKKNFLINQW